MSREIKFRAWDGKEPITWDEIRRESGFWGWLISTPPNVTLMQYTGLKDKNGKEIYEGDIVEYVNGTYRPTGHDRHIPKISTFAVEVTEGLCCNVSTFSKVTGSLEVIGNIYENPELLEQEQ